MEKIWLKHYPAGVPAEIPPLPYANLVQMFAASVDQFADRPAFSNMGTTLDYAGVDRLSARFAAWLQRQTGLGKGDRIAVMLPNVLQYPVAVWGGLRAGLTIVNVNPLYTARELKHQLCDSGAKAIVVLENFAQVLERVIADTAVEQVVLTGLGDLLPQPKRTLVNFTLRHIKRMVPSYRLPNAHRFRSCLGDGCLASFVAPTIGTEDLAFLQYTGGTTGVSKGAMLSHGNILANVMQSATWLDGRISKGQEAIVTALPLYHIFALQGNMMMIGMRGGLNILITNPRDMPGFVKILKKTRFTRITGVNTLFNGLLNTPGFEQLDFSELHFSLGGGMAVQRDVAERWQATTGCTLIEAYGLTETSPAACMNPVDNTAYSASIGLPLPSTELCVQDDNGRMLPPDTAGELCVRGPQVMQGYWQRPQETALVIRDGWLHTGDIAIMSADGVFRLVDRKKDMILVSGFNVYPSEIEDVLTRHPDVLEAGVIGVPNPKSGEIVKAIVVPTSTELDPATLIAWCREELTAYKVPKVIEFTRELPKSNVGKILRKDLRERFGTV